MKALLSVALAAALVLPSAAEVVAVVPTLTVSSTTAVAENKAPVRVGAGISEGKPLQVMVWGGAGAIVGSIAGPAGTVVGAAAGSAFGLLFSMFVVPRFQPGMAPKS
ncbi:MAG: hypothetical protein FD126_2141 [Elusimicrobia bacterium]|nr:MAG: hypothetical protein FD126_2141 [Elusimicrobiota bacterium]